MCGRSLTPFRVAISCQRAMFASIVSRSTTREGVGRSFRPIPVSTPVLLSVPGFVVIDLSVVELEPVDANVMDLHLPVLVLGDVDARITRPAEGDVRRCLAEHRDPLDGPAVRPEYGDVALAEDSHEQPPVGGERHSVGAPDPRARPSRVVDVGKELALALHAPLADPVAVDGPGHRL